MISTSTDISKEDVVHEVVRNLDNYWVQAGLNDTICNRKHAVLLHSDFNLTLEECTIRPLS